MPEGPRGQLLMEWYEIEVGGYVAGKRALDCVINRRTPRGPRQFREFGEANVQGVMAEMAVAKYIGAYWWPTINTFHARDDLPGGFEIRSHADNERGYLIIRGTDKPGAIYVLVTGIAPRLWVRGWFRANEPRPAEWQVQGENTWFVPIAALHEFPVTPEPL